VGSRAESADGRTSPEELIAPRTRRASRWRSPTASRRAAIRDLAQHVVEVDFQPGVGITEIRITLSGEAENLDAEGFKAAAEDAKANCPSPRPRRGADHVERRLRTFRQNNEWGREEGI